MGWNSALMTMSREKPLAPLGRRVFSSPTALSEIFFSNSSCRTPV